jgi:hypothetical protein
MANLTEQQRKDNLSKYVPFFAEKLKKYGVKDNVIPLTIAQMIHESNYFSSNPFFNDNNPAGISWNPNYKTRKGASLGGSRGKDKGNYVHFDSLEDAVLDYVRIINMQTKKNDLGKPADSTNVNDYVNRLVKNGYFTDDPKVYVGGMTGGLKRISKYLNLADIFKKKSTPIAFSFILLAGLAIYYFRK